MRRVIAFDLARMFIGAAGTTPRGIDRVDMGYATRLFADPSSGNLGLVPSPHGMGVLTGREAARFAALVEARWRETRPPEGDEIFDRVKRRLTEAPIGSLDWTVTARKPARRSALAIGTRTTLLYGAMMARAHRSPFRRAAAAVPQGAVYVNTGQVLLGWNWFFAWLDKRPDVRPVFMMHDLIPLVFPEYSGPILSRHHARALRTVAQRGAAMIATSQASADEIRAALVRLGRGDMPIHVVPLPVSDSLRVAPVTGNLAATTPYFVAVGIIDQRKNHLLLLHVWREMIRSGVTHIPKLVIVGSRGLRTASLRDLLDRSPGLDRHVIEVNSLSTPAMREVIRGAHALLMPSYAEGFGLPIIEALALGTPVIASDIPAHREVGGAFATYLDPLDGPGWIVELLGRSAETPDQLARRRAALGRLTTQTWASYFDAVLPFIAAL